MNKRLWTAALAPLVGLGLLVTSADVPGQPDTKKQPDRKRGCEPKGPLGPGGRPGGPGGPGGMMGQRRKLVAQFDKDGDGRLNREERKAAREFLKKERAGGGPGGFRGGP